MKEEKTKNILIVILGIVVLVLAIAVAILSVKKEFIDERYDDLEDRYEYLLEHSQNNNSNLGNSNDNDTLDNPNNNYITRDTALENVLKDLKIERNSINDLDIELEYKVRYGTTVYEVSFDYKYYEYEYYVDPTTGKILDSFKSLN